MKTTRHNPCLMMSLLSLTLLLSLTTLPALAQTYTVIHNFSGGADGSAPQAGLSRDVSGNFYGTASNGGVVNENCPQGCGVTFKLTHRGSGWILTPLYEFNGPMSDGAFPLAAPAIGSNGTLYGTTYQGASACQPGGCGTIYNLHPPATICGTVSCKWSESILFDLRGLNGSQPSYGTPVFDSQGNLYGTTQQGGPGSSSGTVYEISPAGGGWSLNGIYSFAAQTGHIPMSGVTFDSAGNLYGTAAYGGSQNCGNGCGTVYKLSRSGAGWTATTIYSFQGGSDGLRPWGGVIVDQAGNVFGTTSDDAVNHEGTVFELTPSGSGYTFHLLHSFSEDAPFDTFPGPHGNLVMDAAGNLYGTTYEGGAQGGGNVFKLTKTDNGYNYASLYDFSGLGADGGRPMGTLVIDSNGMLYGTTQIGGSGSCQQGCGVIFQLAQ